MNLSLKIKHLKLLLTTFFLIVAFQIKAQGVVVFSDSSELIKAGSSAFIYEDKTNSLNFNDVVSKPFKPTNQIVPNLGISKSTFWLRLKVDNQSNSASLILKLGTPMIDEIEFFYPNHLNQYKSIITGESKPFKTRKYQDPNFFFDLTIPSKTKKTYYLKIVSSKDIVLPLSIGTKDVVFEKLKLVDILSGIYIGIMLVMILYNLFVYISVKDKSYLYYVVYVAIVLLVQTGLQGYLFQYLWPSFPIFSQYSIFLFSSLSGISAIAFMNVFLKVKHHYKKLYSISLVFYIIYLIPIIIPLFGFDMIGWQLLNASSGLASFYMLFVAIMIVKKGYKPANYFLVAWSIFLLGVMIFVLKNIETLPFNNFTRYTMQIGSAIETVLLSFALAARINVYKQEKEDLIRNQNILLEQQVKERTAELNTTLTNLKETQSQLVDAEKMSSLGQLTAGIAHEINNPINFVSSNISPLRRDLDDIYTIINKYEELKNADKIDEKFTEIDNLKKELDFEYLKTEIPEIIKGIEDGATRTKDIVSGLRNFSRLDEAEQQTVNINDGIESTLVLIKSKLNNIELIKDLTEIPHIECFPSKLNQLFMNIIDNAIGAINEKQFTNEKPQIEIQTYADENWVYFKVKDNGIGMNDETKEKMFDPFFTTKEVGQGTGLGLSIVFGIIEKHNGKITVDTEPNKGTTIIVQIPIK